MRSRGMDRGALALWCALLGAGSARAQSAFVLPWVETPSAVAPARPTAKANGAGQARQLPPAPLRQVSGSADSEPEQGGIQLTPPTPERMFRFESEEKLRQRIREEVKNIKVEFPPTRTAAPVAQQAPRVWPTLMVAAEPGFVCYQRLWFEQRNSERYGWHLGVLQPLVATGVFYTDLALLPVQWLRDPCRHYECNTGLCLPGDPVPWLWNPLTSK